MTALLRLGFVGLLGVLSVITAIGWVAYRLGGKPAEPEFFSIRSDKERTSYLKSMTPDQLAELESYGRQSLAREPLNRVAIESLAIVRSLRKQEDAAEKLMLNAAKLSFRNSSIQFSAMAQLLVKKNFPQALYHADGLLRAHPEVGDFVYPLFTKMLADKTFVGELSKTLALEPAWRGPLLDYFLTKGGGPKAAYVVVSDLQRKKLPVSDLELRNLIASFTEAKDYESAYFVWLDSLGDRELSRVRGVYDGEFDLEPRFLYFDWTVGGVVNSRIRVVPRPGSQLDRNLSIDFYNETRLFANVRQFLRLAPGTYKMSYESMARDLKTDGGLVWRTRCLETPSDIGQSTTHRESGPWAAYSFTFTVPEKGCDTQLLTLETVSNAVLDARISGQLNMDKIVIEKRG